MAGNLSLSKEVIIKFVKNGQIEIIPVHGKDVKIGLLVSILKRTGLEVKK